MSFRVGLGFDVHRLVPGRRLFLGGVEIPFELGLLGHSDADVLIHAIADALLGAAGDGDIGVHFPPGDETWRDVRSTVILGKVMERVRRLGFKVVNVDTVVVAQRPTIAPFRESMRRALAGVLGISHELVSIKATTSEGLGFEGRAEGISARAVVLLEPKAGLVPHEQSLCDFEAALR